MALLRGAIVRLQGGFGHSRLVGGAVDGHTGDLLPRRRDEDLLGAGGPGLLRKRNKKKASISERERGLSAARLTRAGAPGSGRTEQTGLVVLEEGGKTTTWM